MLSYEFFHLYIYASDCVCVFVLLSSSSLEISMGDETFGYTLFSCILRYIWKFGRKKNMARSSLFSSSQPRSCMFPFCSYSHSGAVHLTAHPRSCPYPISGKKTGSAVAVISMLSAIARFSAALVVNAADSSSHADYRDAAGTVLLLRRSREFQISRGICPFVLSWSMLFDHRWMCSGRSL